MHVDPTSGSLQKKIRITICSPPTTLDLDCPKCAGRGHVRDWRGKTGQYSARRANPTGFASRVAFGLITQKVPMALCNYIMCFRVAECQSAAIGFLMQHHPQDVEDVIEGLSGALEKGNGVALLIAPCSGTPNIAQVMQHA